MKLQSFSDWELILVDDGSPDDTFALAQNLAAGDPRIRAFTQVNGRQSKARNYGARMASPESKYFYFLDSDDLLHPEALSLMVQHLEQYPQAGVVTSEKSDIDSAGNALPSNPVRRWAPGFLGLPRKLPSSVVITPFTTYFCGTAGGLWSLYRRQCFEKVGGWDESLSGFEDCDLLARLSLVFGAQHIPQVLNYYRKHSDQFTAQGDLIGSGYTQFRAKWEVYVPNNPDEASIIRAARRFQRLVHEPGRYFRVAGATVPKLLREPSWVGFWRFRTNVAAGCVAFWRGCRNITLSQQTERLQ